MKVLYADDLNNLKCAVPGCDHSAHDGTMYVHSRCHPKHGTWASYDIHAGSLTIVCATCGKQIMCIAVARQEPDYGSHYN